MMPDRKKIVQILIIVIGGAYLLYRIFAPKIGADNTVQPLDGPPGYISEVPNISGLKAAADKEDEADRKLTSDPGTARNIFQKPDEFFKPEVKSGTDDVSKKEDNALSLEGVMWGPGRSVAILSGAVVCEGDMIQGGKVIKIEQDKVVILKNGVESDIKRGA